MDPNIITLEPERVNKLLHWWGEPEAVVLLDCLTKAHNLSLVKAAHLQSKSNADPENESFQHSVNEQLKEASDFETAFTVLKSFFPDGPFIQRIEL